MSPVDQAGAVEAPTTATDTPVLPPETSTSVAKVKATKPKAKKAAKKKVEKGLKEAEFNSKILDLLYALRSKHKTKWVDLRNATKEGEELHKLLLKQPQYTWRNLGQAHYLFPRHTDMEDPPAVAFIVKYDPVAEYKNQLADFHIAMKNPKIRKKPPEPPKPVSKAKDYRWVILGKRGAEEAEGHTKNYDEAVAAIMERKHLFPV